MTYLKNHEFKKISRDKFIEIIKTVKIFKSINNKEYHITKISNDFIIGERLSSKNTFKININSLWDAHKNLNVFNTNTLKEYVPGVQSPSFALLIATKLISKKFE